MGLGWLPDRLPCVSDFGGGETAMDKLGQIDRTRVIDLNGIAYYFKAGAGFHPEVLISSHGGYSSGAKKDLDIKGGITLKYYVKHGQTQKDFGIDRFCAEIRPPVVETCTVKTYNYSLTKYQGDHGNVNETYDFISNLDSRVTSHNTKMKKAWEHDPEFQAKVGNLAPFDVVTVRNRCYSSSVDLKTILSLIRRCRRAYTNPTTVHRFFCRSRM
jgi:hypothetical protein